MHFLNTFFFYSKQGKIRSDPKMNGLGIAPKMAKGTVNSELTYLLVVECWKEKNSETMNFEMRPNCCFLLVENRGSSSEPALASKQIKFQTIICQGATGVLRQVQTRSKWSEISKQVGQKKKTPPPVLRAAFYFLLFPQWFMVTPTMLKAGRWLDFSN